MTNPAQVFAMVLTGCGPATDADIDQAFVARCTEVIPTITQRPQNADMGYLYDGNRTKPDNLPWRIYQTCWGCGLGQKPDVDPADVLAGKYDEQIEAGYHKAAQAEYWYAFEKDWGDYY
jgi:hypothetical protein